MKHIKIFEDYGDYISDETYIILDMATIYLENIQPISKNDGFIECEYVVFKDYVLVEFSFKDWTGEENFDKFYNFLKNKRLKIKKEIISNKKYIITVKISYHIMKKFAKEYKQISKYNL